MRKIVITSILVMLSVSPAWGWCDETYTRKVDYLKGTEVIAVQIQTLKTSQARAEKHIEAMTPKIVAAIAAQIPKYSAIKVVNHQPDAGVSLPSEKTEVSSTTIFKFVIRPWQELPTPNLFIVDMTLYLTKHNADKDVAYKEAGGVPLASDAEEHFMEFIKESTKEIISTIICLHDKVCPPSEQCDDTGPKIRREFKSEEDVLNHMKELEDKQ